MINRMILAVSQWFGDEGTNSGEFAKVQDKVVTAGGKFVAFAKGICIAVILIALALGVFFYATGSGKKKEEGKDRMIGAAIARFATGCVFTVLYFIFNSL